MRLALRLECVVLFLTALSCSVPTPVENCADCQLAAIDSGVADSGLTGLPDAGTITSPDAGPAPNKHQERMDALIQPLLDDYWLVGASFALIDGDSTEFYHYGTAFSDGRRANDNTLYEIGSLTKTFTGTLLAEANLEGLSLDTPVQQLLPAEAMVPQFQGKAITLLDLSTHSSGLPHMPASYSQQMEITDYPLDRFYADLGQTKLLFSPGTEFAYSNFGVALLGHALALRKQTTWEALVKDALLKPLAMNDTVVTLNDEQQARLATPHNRDGFESQELRLPEGLVAAGGLRSSLRDLTTYVRAHLNTSSVSVGASLELARKRQRNFPESMGTTAIGLNWMMSDDGVIFHTGATPGAASAVLIDLTRKQGIVVLANNQVVLPPLVEELMGVLNDAPPSDLGLPPLKTLSEQEKTRVEGTYDLPGGIEGDMRITADGRRFLVDVIGGGRFALYPRTSTEFLARSQPGMVFNFELDASGNVTGGKVSLPNRAPVPFTKQ